MRQNFKIKFFENKPGEKIKRTDDKTNIVFYCPLHEIDYC